MAITETPTTSDASSAAGAEALVGYVEPTGRNLGASDLEWSVYAEKL